jgi:hypothetical protein
MSDVAFCSRVSLGIELLKKPSIIFCLLWLLSCFGLIINHAGDEPTSGLDSASAFKVRQRFTECMSVMLERRLWSIWWRLPRAA